MQCNIGNNKIKINLNGTVCNLNFFPDVGTYLLTSDGFILRDSNGVILVAKKEGE